MLDFGCGSGILALAALKLGAVYAVGVDNDPQALLASRENALRNGVAERLGVYLPAEAPVRRYPVVVANILASTLVALAERLAGYVAPGDGWRCQGFCGGRRRRCCAVMRCGWMCWVVRRRMVGYGLMGYAVVERGWVLLAVMWNAVALAAPSSRQ